MVVIAAVDPLTKAVARPSEGPSATIAWTSAVMSITSASPRVDTLSSPLCTAMRAR